MIFDDIHTHNRCMTSLVSQMFLVPTLWLCVKFHLKIQRPFTVRVLKNFLYIYFFIFLYFACNVFLTHRLTNSTPYTIWYRRRVIFLSHCEQTLEILEIIATSVLIVYDQFFRFLTNPNDKITRKYRLVQVYLLPKYQYFWVFEVVCTVCEVPIRIC